MKNKIDDELMEMVTGGSLAYLRDDFDEGDEDDEDEGGATGSW